MSAASPFVCCEPDAPPIARLSAGHLYPDVTIIGAPHFSRRGSSTLSINAVSALTIAELGVLFIPLREAVSDLESSLIEKCFIILVYYFYSCNQCFIKKIANLLYIKIKIGNLAYSFLNYLLFLCFLTVLFDATFICFLFGSGAYV